MKTLSIALFVIISFLGTTQNNVPNPDFEEVTSPSCGIYWPGVFGSSIANWESPTGSSPDAYFDNISDTCFNFQPNSQYPGPIGFKGTQLPRSGHVMAGLIMYTISGFDQRDYIQIPLISPLVVGGKYVVECYVSLGDYCEFASDGMGMLLTTGQVSLGTDGVMPYTPQVTSNGVISEVVDWVRVSDTITATEGYDYLTIGNFANDASTTTLANPTASWEPGTYGSYYFVDDVRVERVIDGSVGVDDITQDPISIYPNPFNDMITVVLPEFESEYDLEIHDATGKLLFSQNVTMSKTQLSLGELPAGVYLLTLRNDTHIYTERIVK